MSFAIAMKHSTRRQFLQTLGAAAGSALAAPLLAQDAGKKAAPEPLDLLVVAPHPDDEILGCGGVLLHALEAKKRVGVVVITSGDGYPALTAIVAKKDRAQLTPEDFMRAGALRQRHSVRAAARIGYPEKELLFLGYPDSGLEAIYKRTEAEPFQQMFTRKNETYGVTVPDYHSVAHGRAAPYLKASVVGDLAEIIKSRRPAEVYVTHEGDTHADHKSAFWYVRDALRAAGSQAKFFTYVVHGDSPAEPPSKRVMLTPAQIETKRAALVEHTAGTSPIHDSLPDGAKPEELFWEFPSEATSK